MVDPSVIEPPPPWTSYDDILTAFLESHPEYDLNDAIEALIWGVETDDENK